MKKLIVFLCVQYFVSLGISQNVLEIPYEATALTEEQCKANPDNLIYPADLEEKVDLVEMFCENDMIAFSVSKTKQVKFSPGNLQYQARTKKWRFAPKQTDYIGEANDNISTTYSGWIDMFCWGTGNNPTKISDDDTDYPSFIDWGINIIGGDPSNTWRTLAKDEWEYIFLYRKNSSQLHGYAQVAGVNGVIILPDRWRCPDGITFKPGFYRGGDVFDNYQYAAHQTITTSQWDKLQQSGAIFLPAAGSMFRGSSYYFYTYGTTIGYYWSSTASDNFEAYFLPFFSTGPVGNVIPDERRQGKSVRLVQDL